MDYFVVKKECVGHVQKRMGSRLMQLKKNFGKKKLDDGEGICVKGHLTQKEVDKIETNCGHAIRSNVGNQTAMKKSYNGSLIPYIRSNGMPTISFYFINLLLS